MYELVANRPNAKLKVVRSREEVFAVLGIQNPNSKGCRSPAALVEYR
jgi:hypothetical protein